ncbi:MAG: hypothetical protein IT310_01160 [Anaerolineales bacterium]|nr:hypothetical protein [Anaerolineales bacterium]
MKIKFAFFTVFIFLSLACQSSAGKVSTESSLPQLSGDWTITFRQSGGFVGLSRVIEIQANGAYTATDERSRESFSGQLSSAELEALIQIAEATKFSQSLEPHGCADCFIYDLQISGSESFTAQVDDVTLSDSGLEPFIDALRKILERNIQ